VIDELYLTTLSRNPTPNDWIRESRIAIGREPRSKSTGPLLWALVN